MNKIFRIVWSQATQSWVVVSELTKAHKKQSSSNSQGSAVKFSGNFIKSSAIALALLSGHSAYAIVNEPGTGGNTNVAWGTSSNASGNNAVAVGRKAQATGDSAIAVGLDSKASGALAEAIGVAANATGDRSVAIGNQGKAEGIEAVAIGKGANASKASAVALGQGAQATGDRASAIGQNSKATQDDTIALGTNSKSTNTYTVALGRNTDAAGQRSMAFGNEAKATANDTIAFGSSSEAKQINDIIIGKEAKSRNEGGGHSIAIGYNSTAGSTKVGAATDVKNTGTNAAAGGVAIGVSSYTGVNRNNAAINSSVAIGAGAGAGFRAINADGIPTGNGTDPDDNATVLSKAFGNTPTEAGNKDEANRFNYKGVDINEGTAVGRNTRAIGDQAVALGAQSIAGQGAIAIGGNDITQFANARYFMSNRDNFGVADVSDHDQSGTLASKTISQKYQELVGAALNTAYQATYAQNGSTVIGMQAHSTTPLGVAIGTNALVRKGAYGATAIGSGSAIQANAEAAVAIGMGSWVNGKFGVAAGTASRAEQSAVAAGYQANANVSAVAIGDHSNATTSSVAVGQLAQATKEADIAVGQGAKASGNQGAIAMGLGTNAQGDSSIMIGGADIKSASARTIEYQKATGGTTSRDVTEKINGKDVTRHYSFSETKEASGTIADAYKELTGLQMETDSINFADANNKNGHASTSLGVHALSKGDLGTAIGASSRADAIGSVALGVGAHATKQNAVAIGTGSTTALVGTRQLSVNYDSDGNIVSDNSDKIAYTFKWAGGTNTSEGDVVSFGSSGAERQLKNVAAGRVAEDSTDAINGSQLNSITKKIAAGFNTSGNVVTGSSGEFTSKKANTDTDPAKKDYETAIRSEDKVQFQVGNNLKLDRNETESEVEVPDDFDKTKTVKKKIRKADFAYSLNPVLTNLTSAEFKGTDAEPTTKLTNAGVTITPVTAGKSPVSLSENGLNNGGNPITDVAGNLDGAKANTQAPTTNATAPNTTDKNGNKYINPNNAATVGDVLNAGWNLKENTNEKDFVTAYDTVNFVDGEGTTVSVTNTDGKTSTIKYSANLGDGLEKTNDNKIKVKAADKSLEVTNEGVKVKAADNTLTTDANGLKVNTGNITASSVPTVADADKDKIATIGNVAEAIKAAAWKATSAATTSGENTGKKDQEIKAGDTVTFEADKNIKIAQADGKFTFATKENVTFNTVQVGGDQGPKLSKSDAGDLKVSGPNSTDPVKVTNVKDGDISADSKDAINGSQFHKLANNTIQLKGQTGDNAVTETNKQALNKENGIAFTVKSSDGTLLEVTAANDTITLTPKTATLTTGADGVPTADTTNGKLVTADQLVNTLTEMGWKATAGKDGSGTVSGAATELIKAGNTVTFKAGDNLAVKQDGKNFIYSLQKELTGLTSAEFKNQAGDTTVINSDGMKITPKDAPANPVSLTKDGLDNGGKTIKNVTSGLTNYGPGTPKEGLVDLSKPATGNPTVPDTTAATVGDLRNMGWVVSSDKTTGDLAKAYTDQVKNADEVKFVGEGGVTVSGKTENGIRTITVKAEAQEMPEQPVSYTTADGTKVYPKTVTKEDGTQEVKYYSEPNGKGKEIPKENVIASINGPEGTKAPTTLSNVAGNLDGAKKDTKAPTTEHGPVNTTDAAAPNYVNPNNAATVGDVLNAGWNLQNNGTAKDFVKPYDTVNFVDGINTKAVVTTDAEGKVSNVQIDVKDLPIAYTNEAGDKVVKAADGKYYKESDLAGKVYDPETKKFKNANGTVLNEQPTEVAGNDVKTNLVNPNAEANKAGDATQLGNVASGANTFAPVEDKKLGNDGKWYPADQVESNGQPKKDASPVAVPNNIGKAGLIDFSKSNPNNAATVGDLQNLGWIVSAKGNDYSDQVRNANEVKFVGEGTASVTGKTDENGVRTITVKVDDQVSTNNAQMPVNYTTADGTKVYPVKDEKGNVTYHTTPDGKGQGDKEIPKGDVITSINGPEGTTTPTTLKNVKGNLPQVNDQDKTVNGPDGKPYTKDGNNVIGNTKAPITAVEAADIVNKSGNNAATVGDVLNAGWNLQNNGEDRDFVKPYDTVNFVNGTGTVAVVETNDKASTSNVTFNVDMAEMTPESDGSVKGPVSQDLLDALDAAQAKVDENPNDEAAQEALKAAEDAVNKAGGNKVANAQNVADMINSSGFTLKTSEVDGGKKVAGTKDDGELINPGKTVEMVAGKNMSVKQDENGKVTYATKDDVSFNTVNVGDDNTYIDEKGNPVTKKKDGTYVDANGQPIEESKVTKVAPVAMKAEKAKPATNNGNEAKDQPTTALNVSSTGGKPTQITGVGSTLNVNPVDTNPNGTATTGDARPNLVDLVGTDKAPVNKNAAATVGDLQNMGWIVGAPENGYVDTVKNANKVDFKGENGISVTGKTNDKGVREITISVAEGKVTNDVKVTKADGTVIDGVKGPDGKLYKKGPDGKPDTSKEITLAEGDKVNNEGSKFVSGNAVATAIQESGWNVGLADSSKANAAFSDKDKALSANKLEKVNPNDNVRFADGKGTKAAVATVERVDEFGKKVTDTYVKFDVDAGEITADTTKPGMVKGPVTADEAKKLADDLKKAEQAVKDLPADATPEAKKAAQDALKVAQDAAAPLNKVATAQNVAEAINNSGWRTNSTTATGGAKDTLINPGKAVNFEAGKNMEVAQTVDKDGNVAYTYKTKDDVQFNSVQFGDANGPKITNNGGNINVSGADGKAPTKITGVAAGDISPNSTDAVNGAQIYALVGDQSNVNQTSPTYTKVDLDENGKPSYTTVNAPAGKTVVTAKDDNGHDVPVLKTYNVHSQKEIVTNSVVEAIHNMNEQGIKFFHSNDGVERPKQEQTNSFDSSASGKFATAIGSRSKADGTNAVAIGFNSVVTGNDSISIGTGNRVTGNNSGAFGDPSTVSGQGSYSVGNNNTVATNDTFVLGNEVKHTVENSAILGAKSTARGGNGSKTGTLRNLKQDGTQGASTTAGSTGTVSTATVGHMTYGGFQGDKADGVVSVGAAGNERRIQNVAAGEISKTSTDAINGSQLYAVAAGIGHKLGDLDNKINKVGKRGDAGTASALAAANIPQAYTPGKSLVGIAAGSYQGQNGLAVGMSRISDNGKIIIRLSGTANSQGKTGVAAGVGYQW